jgi:capsular exopolysaccharide synthesis family protein
MSRHATTGLVDLGSPSAEPFRSLRLALTMHTDPERSPIVLFTSADAGEGKSTIAANYARTSSMGTKSVVLIDADMRQPSLHQLFEIPRVPGVVDICTDNVSAEEAVVPVPGFGNLSVIPAGSAYARTADLASSPRMGRLIGHLSDNYDSVILDTAPLLSAADAGALATLPNVDVVLVIDQSAKRRTILNAMRKLQLINANVLGVVLNHEGRLSTYGY